MNKGVMVLTWFLVWAVIETEGKGYTKKQYWNLYAVEATSEADCEAKLADLQENLQHKNYIARCEQRSIPK